MSAALKSYEPRPLPSRRRTATARTKSALPHQAGVPQASGQSVSPPVVLSAPANQSNQAMRVLSQLHAVSSALAISLVGLALISYGTSVYISRQLSQTNQQLNRLQRNEQQLTTANEVLKNYLAQQVVSDKLGFQPPQPGSVIFLQPTHRAAAVALPSQGPSSGFGRLMLPKVDVPLGY